MNDDLNGVERPVTFPIKDMNEAQSGGGSLAGQMETGHTG